MKLILIAFMAATLLADNASAQPAPQPNPRPRVPPGLAPRRPPGSPMRPPAVMPEKDKLSYAIGMSIASNIKRVQLELNVDTLAAAMKDVLGDKPTRITEAELKETMTEFQRAMPAWIAAKNKAKGEAFLAKNKETPGVTSLPNGLQYRVVKEGSGAMPKTNETVIVAYKGRLVDGTVFDQNEHFTTAVTGRTIKGWSDILPLMKTGSKWEVAIPSDLAYGPRGTRGIGPDSVLVFDMELLSIEPPGATPAPTPVSNRPPPLGPHRMPPTPPSPGAPSATTTPVVSGQIIKVPSAEELKKGAKIEVITNPPPSQ